MKKIIILLTIGIFLTFTTYAQRLSETVYVTKEMIEKMHEKDTIKLIKLPELIIKGNLPFQATAIVPITYKNITQHEITAKNYGQEPSQIFNATPSITTYSENGTGWGYSYIRLRGIDQTRINMTLNGVPLNEPEDQGCYFSNYPDFLESIKMIQLQRGTGMSKNGVSSFAGSVILESGTNKNEGQVTYGFGSLGSSKLSGKAYYKNFYVQLSKIETDGYKEHSGNKSKSIFYGYNKKIGNSELKIFGFSGHQENQLAWLGAPMDSINKNPRYNTNTLNENDDFNQNHIQVHLMNKINDANQFNVCVYYNYLKGWYTYDDQMIDTMTNHSTIYKYKLKSNFAGFYANHIYTKNRWNIYSGLHAYLYDREHNGFTNNSWSYVNTGNRNEISGFIKGIYKLKNFNIFGDLQYRHSIFSYDGDVNMETQVWDFVNPSFGVNYQFKNNIILYYSIGNTHREPTRNDMFGGWDNLYTTDQFIKIEPESVVDHELGFRYNKDKKIYLNANLYYMNFKNEITLNGKTGPTGLLLHSNVASSFRSGIEFDVKYLFDDNWEFVNNTTYSYSEIEESGVKLKPVLTPPVVVNQEINYNNNHYSIGYIFRYQDKSYIDFANDYTVNSYVTHGFRFGLNYNHFEWNIFFNNITNEKYFTNGLLDWYGKPTYFVSAPYNFFTNFKFKF